MHAFGSLRSTNICVRKGGCLCGSNTRGGEPSLVLKRTMLAQLAMELAADYVKHDRTVKQTHDLIPYITTPELLAIRCGLLVAGLVIFHERVDVLAIVLLLPCPLVQ